MVMVFLQSYGGGSFGTSDLYYVIHGRPLVHLSCRSVSRLIPSMTNTKIPPLTFCTSCFAPHYHNHQTNTEIIPNIKRQVCILFVGAARFLYWTLGRCRSARSMHAPEKSDIHRQVYNPYLYPCYHFVHQKYFLLTQTPIFEVSQLRPRCFAICSAI